MSGRTAQEAFAELVRVHIAPGLRRLGFKGSGRAFQMPDESRWIQLGIQRSVHSDGREIRFTVNAQIADRRAWDALRSERAYLPQRPAPNTRYDPSLWQQRIGLLMPDRRDRWWDLTPATDLERLGSELVTAITTYVMPAIQREIGS